MSRKGKRWRPAGNPVRLRATNNCYFGVVRVIAALDLAAGKLSGEELYVVIG